MTEYPSLNPEILDILEQRGELILSPNKVYDDEIILELAVRNNSVIVSNDEFRDFYKDPRILAYLKGHK
jgi:predicted nuclease of predicted toxin-antitoxin system